jgi:hypothetical protein
MKFLSQFQPPADRKEAQTDSEKQEPDDDFIDAPVFMSPGHILNPVKRVPRILKPKTESEEKNSEN